MPLVQGAKNTILMPLSWITLIADKAMKSQLFSEKLSFPSVEVGDPCIVSPIPIPNIFGRLLNDGKMKLCHYLTAE